MKSGIPLIVSLLFAFSCSSPETKEVPRVNVDSIPFAHQSAPEVKALIDSATRIGNNPALPDYEMRAMEFAMQAYKLDSVDFAVRAVTLSLRRNAGMISEDDLMKQYEQEYLMKRLFMIGVAKQYEDKGDTTTVRRYYESVAKRTQIAADSLPKYDLLRGEANILHTIALICLDNKESAKKFADDSFQQCDDIEQRHFFEKLQTTTKDELYAAYNNKKW